MLQKCGSSSVHILLMNKFVLRKSNCTKELHILKKMQLGRSFPQRKVEEINYSKEVTALKSICRKIYCSKEIAAPNKSISCRTSYSEEFAALKNFLLWWSRFSENKVVLEKLLLMREKAYLFLKARLCLCHTFTQENKREHLLVPLFCCSSLWSFS